MAWIITKDHADTDAVGVIGPRGVSARQQRHAVCCLAAVARRHMPRGRLLRQHRRRCQRV